MTSKQIHIPYTQNPSENTMSEYSTSKRGRAMLFQVTDPVGVPLFPYSLALHMNPGSLSEKMQKSKNIVHTYGGIIEYVWPDEFDNLSATASSGAFIGPDTGLVSGQEGLDLKRVGDSRSGSQRNQHGRHETIAWERQEDLLDLFRNNGIVYNSSGQPVIRGRVLCVYDRGIFQGHFTNFVVNEDDDHPFNFELSWEFKVEKVLYQFSYNSIPGVPEDPGY